MGPVDKRVEHAGQEGFLHCRKRNAPGEACSYRDPSCYFTGAPSEDGWCYDGEPGGGKDKTGTCHDQADEGEFCDEGGLIEGRNDEYCVGNLRCAQSKHNVFECCSAGASVAQVRAEFGDFSWYCKDQPNGAGCREHSQCTSGWCCKPGSFGCGDDPDQVNTCMPKRTGTARCSHGSDVGLNNVECALGKCGQFAEDHYRCCKAVQNGDGWATPGGLPLVLTTDWCYDISAASGTQRITTGNGLENSCKHHQQCVGYCGANNRCKDKKSDESVCGEVNGQKSFAGHECVSGKCGQLQDNNFRCCVGGNSYYCTTCTERWCNELPNGEPCKYNGQCNNKCKTNSNYDYKTCQNSDRRLKENIVLLEGQRSPRGAQLYSYTYRSIRQDVYGTDTKIGVMAQELLGTGLSDAVSVDRDGFYCVDYDRV